jgi:hypothetical protein
MQYFPFPPLGIKESVMREKNCERETKEAAPVEQPLSLKKGGTGKLT